MSTITSRITTTRDAAKYRPDIDGLRAVAVLAVVVFHAFPSLLRGGFVGVDIFFVISGFLITNILLSELEAEAFSISRFYVRRIRRIFPALIAVLIAVYALGWYSLFKDEYKQLGKHILAASCFVANLAFWNEAGYFDTAAQTKPLLHLWSLGVEEQFYIIWPLMLAMAYRRRLSLLGLIVAGGIISFGVNIALVSHHPAAAFFSPFSRFWELIAGALLAWSNQTQLAVNTYRENWRSVAGLALCAAAMLGLNSGTDFPGWWALLPVVGAALLISGRNTMFNDRVLGFPPLVWIGKISFPLYLWHWPLLSFATILTGGPPEPHVRAAAVALSVALAWLSCVAIEKPVRFGKQHWSKVAVPCVLLIAMGYIGGMTYVRDGLGFRKGYSLTADVTSATLGAGHEFVKPECGVPASQRRLFQFCSSDRRETPSAVVWGDSKADALYWGLLRESTLDRRWSLIARTGCAPMSGVVRISSYAKDDPDECASANRVAMRAIIANHDIKLVVLAAAARVLVGPEYAAAGTRNPIQSAALDGLDVSIGILQKAGKQVALVMDNPTLPDPRECMGRKLMGYRFVQTILSVDHAGSFASKCAITYGEHLAATAEYRADIAKLHAMHPDMLIYDPAPVLCDMKKGVCPVTRDGKFLYSYGDHISDSANRLIADQLLPQLEGSTWK
ncbi:Peptidoglycan/LPS O-acetylase OafA/YrhL, contains acyltransferase and SGNH-hydrolase domains [Paraburkholderia diazotrophica]|uniref:Peptidoglycan/LPS O-acetylase OafA/YrhL, contains acyltransferase and SGNH-hydrolase domains n=2 Tax=Paraburkholderia diazotrophica TaxID=667676 RepID=A0A1H7DJ59_9BURK|nr:Peptidoglycan/LPS O-acetylase OafA/YrhL, contains acyltransferase and SGNH-hydrolase domains [Paraburkholderia diazotrophica]